MVRCSGIVKKKGSTVMIEITSPIALSQFSRWTAWLKEVLEAE